MTTQSRSLAPSLDRRSLLRSTVMVAGAAVALPTLGSLAGCKFAPASLTDLQPLIRAISARVIPETDTPGALTAGVPEYITAVFEQHFTEEQQSDFASGLEAIAALHEAGFAEASEAEQDAMLTQLSDAADGSAGKATWQQLRDMAVFGFYTSETASEQMPYEDIPGRYDGCVPLAEIGGAWLDRGV